MSEFGADGHYLKKLDRDARPSEVICACGHVETYEPDDDDPRSPNCLAAIARWNVHVDSFRTQKERAAVRAFTHQFASAPAVSDGIDQSGT